MIDELTQRIEALQERKNALIKKEKLRKEKAQEKWKIQFLKSFTSQIERYYSEDYETVIDPGLLSDHLGRLLKDAGPENVLTGKAPGAGDDA